MTDLSASRTPLARRAGIALVLCVTGLFGAGACSGAAGTDKSGDPGAAQPGGTNGGAGDGGAPSFGSDIGQTPSGDFEECATSSQEATLVPLNMLLMVDRSGSMQDNSKWNKATLALKAFVRDPESGGLRVALRFFPDDECNDDTCDVQACSLPTIDAASLTAEAGDADPQEQALVEAIDDEDPNGNATPIYAALAGAEKWATDYRGAHPSERAIVILVTDGAPNGCEEDIDSIAALAGDAYASGEILTYGVGLVGSQQTIMDEIARQGGTDQGFFIGNGDAEADLLAALKDIQGNQVACEFQMPPSQNGAVLDPSLINVTYTAGGGAEAVLGQVAGSAACGSSTGGWYYDDPSNPSSIALCQSTCQIVQGDPNAKIKIVVGCGTRPAR